MKSSCHYKGFHRLLGRIIDKLSGEPFTRFIKERQFDAVGMPLAGFGDSHDVVPHIWPTATRPEHRAIGPTGGGRAALFVYPDDNLAVVILTNLIGASPESFIDEVAGYFIPDMRASAGFGLPPAVKALHAELMKRGFDHALAVVNEAKQKDAMFDLREADLNDWGYKLLEQGETKAAVEIFKLNVSLYSGSWNTYDSLAEAYEAVGNRALASENHERSVALNAKHEHGVERLKALRAAEARPGGQ